MIAPTQAQLDAGFALLRAEANKAGPLGHMVSDDKLKAFVSEFAATILNADAPKAA
jgi:hypothetical protein